MTLAQQAVLPISALHSYPRPSDAGRSALARLLDEAVAGHVVRRSSILLSRGSRLPGPRANSAPSPRRSHRRVAREALWADGVALAMAHLSADEAPGRHGARVPAHVWRRGPGRARHVRRGGSLRAWVRRRASRARRRPALPGPRSRGRRARPDRGGRGRCPGRGDGVVDGRLLPRGRGGASARAGAVADAPAAPEPDGPVRRLDEAFALARDAPRAAGEIPGSTRRSSRRSERRRPAWPCASAIGRCST